MWLLAFLLLLPASTGNQIVDEVQQIPAGDWKYREIDLHRFPGRVSANYEVLSPQGNVRAALMLHEDLERMDSDLSGSIVDTPLGRRGEFTDGVRRRGDYVVVLDNLDGRQAVTVRLRVWVDFGAGPGYDVGQLTPQRRLVIMGLSFAVFLGIVGFSARRLLREMRR